MRASSPASPAACFADALASANRDCAAAATSIAKLSASGSPQTADLLGRLSSHPNAPDAVLAAAIATSRVGVAAFSGAVDANAKIFPCGPAVQQLARAAASADTAAARHARRECGRTTLIDAIRPDLSPPRPPPDAHATESGPDVAPNQASRSKSYSDKTRRLLGGLGACKMAAGKHTPSRQKRSSAAVPRAAPAGV